MLDALPKKIIKALKRMNLNKQLFDTNNVNITQNSPHNGKYFSAITVDLFTHTPITLLPLLLENTLNSAGRSETTAAKNTELRTRHVFSLYKL